jgi:hypothetical protein
VGTIEAFSAVIANIRRIACDNNWCENSIRLWVLGRSNWLLLARYAAVNMQFAQLKNGHDPYAYLEDLLTRLPTQRVSEITELLPHKRALFFYKHEVIVAPLVGE